ncbi:hypothetical protein NGRA_2935 [Nosema granulosis]|uniref:Uncharacterized protein n=1 Tax=Nosema granulosis TaxID=83296 RepID=A0A9P6GVR1_9MICR|nr:hypothetical protein NGRA_2935 [Nosema granulosis]
MKTIKVLTKVISKRTERWKLIFNDFDLTIKNISENENNIAYQLSRCFYIKSEESRDLYTEVSDCLEKDSNTPKTDTRNRYIIETNKAYEFIKKLHLWSRTFRNVITL